MGNVMNYEDIENPEAYMAAIERNIRNNAYKTWSRTQERADEIEQWLNVNGQVDGDKLKIMDGKGLSFADSLEFSLLKYGKLSPKQGAAVLKIIDGKADRQSKWDEERKAQYDAAEAIINGKQVITGKILSVKRERGTFGYDQVVEKMLVQDDRGFKVWGTLPRSISDLIFEGVELKGQRVSFTATVEASKDDEKFGFFKRPTKAAIAA